MKNLFTFCILFLLVQSKMDAQIINGQDTLYGNEWIHFDQAYFKILVAEDGIYRIPYQTLINANLPIAQAEGSQFQIFHNGEEIPIYLSNDGILGSNDYIEFYGQKNTSELDRYLFKDPDNEMMNPLYSLFTDTAAYFLTWRQMGSHMRYENLPNNLVNLPPKEDYFMAEQVLNYYSTFSKKSNSQNISSSDYGVTEGYSNPFATVQMVNLSALNPYMGGPDAQLSIRYGTNIGQHQQQITLNGQPLITDEFSDFQVRKLDFGIQNGTLAAPLEIKFEGLASGTDKQRISNITLRFPSIFNFNNRSHFAFNLPASAIMRYLEIENFNSTGGMPLLYDLTNHTRMNGVLEGGVIKIALPPSNLPVRLVLVNDGVAIKTIDVLSAISFIDYKNINAAFIILSNSRLYDDGNGNNPVQEYAAYRSSVAGGSYSTILVDVQQVYDQYGWGLNRHPLSIRNFAHYVKKYWPDAQYFFIVGKGREYPGVRTNAQITDLNSLPLLVPTFGYPGSDNLLLSSNSTATPILAIGRIPVSNPTDLKIFAKKIRDYESNVNLGQSIEDRAWMKNVLHLGGGGNASEQSLIKSYLKSMQNIIENGKFGAEVTSLYKTSTDPIQMSQSDEIFNTINEGASIITFFGHSAVGTFDFSIDNPASYDNFKKYPIMFSLGCYSGNIHTANVGIGERFIFFEDRGAIGFAAASAQAYISSLNTLTSKSYELIGGDLYGESVGKVLQAAIHNFDDAFGLAGLTQQFTYAGDPATKINSAPGPDYVVDRSSISFSPTVITAQQSDFNIQFNVLNLGKNIQDSIEVEVEMEYPNGQKNKVIKEKVKAPGYISLLSFKIPISGREVVGLNKFYITIDASNEVMELPAPAAETNNKIDNPVTLFILDNSAIPVYPAKYAIVGSQGVELKASTSNAFASSQKYLLEIDTTEQFNSTWKKTTEIIQGGGVIKWKPNVPLVDSTVYYWRISPEPGIGAPDFVWESSSFIYLEGSLPGWNQSHYYQFLKDTYNGLSISPNTQRLEFDTIDVNVRIRNKIYNSIDKPGLYYDFSNPAASVQPWSFLSAGIAVVVSDPKTAGFWKNPPGGGYGSVNTNNSRVFAFKTSTVQERSNLINFLRDTIPDGYHVMVFSILGNENADIMPGLWAADSVDIGTNLFKELEGQGAALVRQFEAKGTVPYVFMYQKGIGTMKEGIADTKFGIVDINDFLTRLGTQGYVVSELIGPAKSWADLSWEYGGLESDQVDTLSLSIIGLDKNLEETVLAESIVNLDTSLTFIDAAAFPYIKLKFSAKDEVYRSVPNLMFWRVHYSGVPEVAVNPQVRFVFQSDTLQQGQNLVVQIGVENISEFNMDSLLVKFSIVEKSNNEIVYYKRLGPLEKDQNITAECSFETRNLQNSNNLVFEVNPNDDQIEFSHQNNFLFHSFFVEKDRRNSLLDVTFDGSHILDGEIISPQPKIVISLQDENNFLILADTSLFKMFVKEPGKDVPEQIYFSNASIEFVPGGQTMNGENKALIRYNPVFIKDGIYQLLVQASDVTGNPSGQFDFKTSFEIITKSSISNLIAYPNPFSTSTRFVYTLTGQAPPTQFKIQVMTVAGRIVREFTQEEIGELKTGTHMTDFSWDGTDEFRDKLANGVYLYRVLANDMSGKDFESFDNIRDTGTSKYFNGGFGKIVIIR